MPLCRVCLKSLPVCLSLSDEGGSRVEKMLSDLTGISKYHNVMTKEMLSNICYRCYCDIKLAHAIQQKVIKAQEFVTKQVLKILENNDLVSTPGDIEVEPISDIKLDVLSDEFECKICGDDHDDYQDLLNHTAEHYRGPQICLRCDTVFLSMASYRRHFSRKHPEMLIFKCPFCPLTFRYNTLLKIHKESLHTFKIVVEPPPPTREQNNKSLCEICGKVVSKIRFYRHMKNHSNKTKCEYCGNHYSNITSLQTHQNRYHFQTSCRTKRQLICQTCGRIFYGINTLRIHERQHTNDHPYKCELCNVAFKQNVLLRRHKRLKHLIMEAEPVKCNVCSKRFFSTQSLSAHIGRAHFKKTNDSTT